jgi:hypothetical protein
MRRSHDRYGKLQATKSYGGFRLTCQIASETDSERQFEQKQLRWRKGIPKGPRSTRSLTGSRHIAGKYAGVEFLTTASSLRSQTAKKLAKMAKQKGVPGWHSMRKEQLVTALLKLARQTSGRKTTVASGSGKSSASSRGSSGNAGSNGSSRTANVNRTTAARKKTRGKAHVPDERIVRVIREENRRREQLKDLARVTSADCKSDPEKDRVVLLVRDPYWIQAYWEITRATVQRASVAFNDRWHEVKPVIRLYEITDQQPTHAAEQHLRDIPVHGGVKNWFIDVTDPPRTYRIAIGYLLPNHKFYLIAKSNKVTTPIPSSSETVDLNWTDIAMNHQKFYALSGGYSDDAASDDLREVFEEKLRRPMSTPMFAQIAASTLGGDQRFEFAVDAEMIIYGTADPNASVTLAGEPVKLRNDGTFEVRMSMPDRRQVLPIVACSRDGTEQRTTVVAVERNTKVMEPISRDLEDA